MMFKFLTTGFGLAIGAQLLLASPAEADHRRHWFYDHYRSYDSEAFDYRRQPRVYRRRNLEFGFPFTQPRYDPYADDAYYGEDEYVARRPARKTYPWRERVIRYDLSRKQPGLRRQRSTLAPPPVPRRKPLLGARRDEQLEYSALPPATQDRQTDSRERKAKAQPAGSVSCREAREIVAGFGFSDIETRNCQGKTYSFAAKRDGKPFEISLSSQNGELTKVSRL